MPDTLTKLRPDRDLQCYFQEPSAIAAFSDTSPSGFTLSGCWRQQFDWAVVEWNRDNVIEHPAFRNLPDGDLTGLRLSYEESRTNCIPTDSTIYDATGWATLRIWEWSNNQENLHLVPLKDHATPIDGSYIPASIVFELQGTVAQGDYVELSWLDQHATYLAGNRDTTETVIQSITGIINSMSSAGISASAEGTRITLTCNPSTGSNGNRIGAYGGVKGSGTVSWSPQAGYFSGGASPQKWRVDLDFGNLIDTNGRQVSTSRVRKVRWTWAADWQPTTYARAEFSVRVENWHVDGTGLSYQVAGPGSLRIEDDSTLIKYNGDWVAEPGNYSGGSIRHATRTGASFSCRYTAPASHTLLLGTRYSDNGGKVEVQVDGGAATAIDLKRAQEDVLIRVPLGQLSGGTEHSITVQHCGPDHTDVYFDFVEIAAPTAILPAFEPDSKTTLATDWDTYHALAIAPERTAWLIHALGFHGRANHYAGAMWFYELSSTGNQYASGSITFSGTPPFSGTTAITVGDTVIQHLNSIGDTAETIAKCFEFLLSAGSSAVWARADGPGLVITARAPGIAGNSITIAASTNSQDFTATVSGPVLSGGTDGRWTTDLSSKPRLNRAARDWSRSYFRALRSYGIDVAAAFSMELRHGDDSRAAGIAQRYPGGPVWLNTPALQTNFGPASLAFWQQVYTDMAEVMSEAGMPPYLQFGEVQWWYFADNSGMPFYDDYTTAEFQATYGRPLSVISSQNADPTALSAECSFLPRLIGNFTDAVMAFVRKQYPEAKFEVLYPPDTNDTPLNRIVNFPADSWCPSKIACLKTENFTYTGNRDLNKARESIDLPLRSGFGAQQRSHLVGIGDKTSPWLKEQELALGAGVESVVLFALDQFCLIGYAPDLESGDARATYMGA